MKFKKEIVVFTIYDYLKILPYLDQVNEIFVKKRNKKKRWKIQYKRRKYKRILWNSKQIIRKQYKQRRKRISKKNIRRLWKR